MDNGQWTMDHSKLLGDAWRERTLSLFDASNRVRVGKINNGPFALCKMRCRVELQLSVLCTTINIPSFSLTFLVASGTC